jgi:transcriptional regulator with XRE-family HTH domain
METTFSFGYWVRRRRKALNLTQAALAQQVGCATITVKKIERDERRPSRVMAERLADSLMVAPTERQAFVAGGLGETPVDSLLIAQTPLPAAPLSLASKSTPEERYRFVGREGELRWLELQLSLAVAGHGRIAFIGGEAGRGKTTLLGAFVQRAARNLPALLTAGGTCNAYAGTGDPYLPFREALSNLTGEAETRWLPAAHVAENARRLWQALPTTLSLLTQQGPQLVDVLVPAKGLLARAQTAAPGGATWLAQLKAEIARREAGAAALDQSALFAQFTNVLCSLSRAYPLLITLDDLHWADQASLGLLFHLIRRLEGSRILIIGTCRPEELGWEHEAERHPLVGALSEVKRTYGETFLDLDAADRHTGHAFVNAFLDTEPNRLDQSFRQALFHQTGGHPLFTVELLREMQARQDLVLDAGFWCAGQALDWTTLPARVEAVIARRLDRLEPLLRDMLAVASVEGDTFTAEVVARVLGVDEGLLLRSLSHQLAQRRRLIRECGEVAVPGRVLSAYQFDHALFQAYIYQQLSPGERRRLHAGVAAALEALYSDQADDIAVQLAQHYQAARQPRPAAEYLRRAAEKALRLSAPLEAIRLLEQGLALLAALVPASGEARQTLRLQLLLGEARRRAGRLAEAMETFHTAATLAYQLNETGAQVHAALGYEDSRWRFNLPAGTSVRLLMRALASLSADQVGLHARLEVSLAQALVQSSSPEAITDRNRRVLALARESGDPRAIYEALNLIVRYVRRPEETQERLAAMEEMRTLLATAPLDPAAYTEVYGFRMQEHLELGDLAAALADQAIWVPSIHELQQPLYIGAALMVQTMLALLGGRFAEAEQLAGKAVAVNRQLQVEHVDGTYGMQMFTIRREQGRLAELASVVRHFVIHQPDNAIWRPGLALIYSELDLWDEAYQEFERQAGNDFTLPRDEMWSTCMAYLAEVCAYLGDAPRAARLYARLRPYCGRNIMVGYLALFLGPVDYYLGRLSATQCHWAEAEQHFLEALDMNTRMEAWPWLAHTQYAYARMLRQRGRAADQAYAQQLARQALETAERLGMRALAGKVTAMHATGE